MKTIEVQRDGNGWPHHTVAVGEPELVWWRQVNGKPGYVDFVVYSVLGVDVRDGTLLYTRRGSRSSMDDTKDLGEAEWLARGTVKWDGCTDWETDDDCRVHHCTRSDLTDVLRSVERAHEIALEMVGAGL